MGKFYCYAMQINAQSFQLGFCFTFHLTAFTFDFVWNGFYCSNREITSWNICDKCKALNDEQYKKILLSNSICICRLLVVFCGWLQLFTHFLDSFELKMIELNIHRPLHVTSILNCLHKMTLMWKRSHKILFGWVLFIYWQTKLLNAQRIKTIKSQTDQRTIR